jgi:hypothetical protein
VIRGASLYVSRNTRTSAVIASARSIDPLASSATPSLRRISLIAESWRSSGRCRAAMSVRSSCLTNSLLAASDRTGRADDVGNRLRRPGGAYRGRVEALRLSSHRTSRPSTKSRSAAVAASPVGVSPPLRNQPAEPDRHRPDHDRVAVANDGHVAGN